ncbi:MAG: hypothetical protein E7497_05200 [Ruminococcus sp.]|nr:hypothetical protein [Ruminococcus sp.]
MHRKKKKTFVRAVFVYLLLTTGLWMFLNSYSNSYNRLSVEKLSPASLIISEDKAQLKILNQEFTFGTDALLPESKLYYVLYVISPDEVHFVSDIFSLSDHIIG